MAFTGVLGASSVAQAQIDLVLNVNDTPDPVPATGIVTYAVSIDNNGATTAPGVSYTMNVPASATYRGFGGGTGASCSGMSVGQAGPGVVTCTHANLSFGATASFTVRLNLNAQGTVNVVQSAATSGVDADPSNNTVTSVTTVTAGADFGVVLSAPASAPSGSSVAFGLTVTNAGPDPASALQVQFPVPTGFVQQGALPSGCSLSAGTILCTVAGPIASGGTFNVGSIPGKLTVASVGTVTGVASIALLPGAPALTPQDPNTADNSSTTSITVTAGSDVRLSVGRSVAGPYFVGGTFSFQVSVAYDGDSPANLVLTDTLPANYTIGVVASPQSGWTCTVTGQIVRCTRASGGTAGFNRSLGTILIPVTIASAGTVTNFAHVSTTTIDPTLANNSASDGGAALQDPTADLSITKTGPSPALVVVGVPFAYTITARNNGPFTFEGTIVVTDTIPAGVRLTGVTAVGWTCSPVPLTGPGILTCSRTYGTGAGLASATNAPAITLTAEASVTGSLTTTAALGTTGANVTDSNLANNVTSYTVTSSVGPNAADVRVLQSPPSPDPVAAGEVLTYRIEVVNAGPATAASVTLTDTLAALINNTVGASGGYVGHTVIQVGVASAVTCTSLSLSGTSRALSCAIPSLPVCTAGSDCPVVEVQIRPGGNGGVRSNAASAISSVTADADVTNNRVQVSSQVDPRADVSVTKTDSPDPVAAGQNLTYVITARSNGPSQALNVTIDDVLPLNVLFVSATPSTGTCAVTPTANSVTGAGNRNVTCNLGTIANGAQQTVTIVVRPATATRGTTLTNDVTVSTTTIEPPSPGTSNNTATAATAVSNPSLDLLVNNTDTVDPVTVGSATAYTVTITNNGPSDAENVVVTDALPATGLTFQGQSISAGSCPTVPAVGSVGGTLICTVPRIAAGASVILTVNMQGVTKGVTTNNVSISSDEIAAGFDLISGNNSAPQATTVRTRADVEVASVTPSIASVGLRRPYQWVIRVRNNPGAGLAEADSVRLSDNLPAGTELTGTPTVSTPSLTCTGVAGQASFTCDLGTIASGDFVDITVPVRTIVAPTGGTTTNSASVTTSSADAVPGNNANSGVLSIISGGIAGVVFRDFNNNGALDPQDTGVAGVTMSLTGTAFDAAAITGSVTTGAGGTFLISGLPEGTFAVQRGSVTEPFLTVGTQTAGTSGGAAGTPPSITAIALGEGVSATGYRYAFVPQPRVGLAKQVLGQVANPNGTLTAQFRIAVDNPSLEPLSGIQLSDVVAGPAPQIGTFVAGGAGATLTAGTYTIEAAPTLQGVCATGVPNAGFDGSTDTSIGTITTLAQGQSCAFLLSVRYAPTVPLPAGNYSNQASASGSGALSAQPVNDQSQSGSNSDPDGDGNPGNNNTPTPLGAFLLADVTTQVTVPASVPAGGTVSGTVLYRNIGPYTANATTFTMGLTSGLTGVSFGNLPAGATATYNPSNGQVTLAGMPTSLASGAIASGDGTGPITVQYTQNGAANTALSSTIATSSNEGANTGPNSANATVTGPLVADVATTIAAPASVDAGQTVNAVVVFRNTGPSTASGLAYQLTLSSALSGVVLGNLPAGATATYNSVTGVVTLTGMPVALPSGALASGNGTSGITVSWTQPGTATSAIQGTIGTSTGQGPNAAPDDATATITGQFIADVTTTLAFPASVNAGQPVTGTIVFTNTGPSVAQGMTYALTLTTGLSGVVLGNLPAGAAATYNPVNGQVTFTGMPVTLAAGAIASGNGTSGLTLTYTQPGTAVSSILSTIGTSTSQGANAALDAAAASPGGGLIADVRTLLAFPATADAGTPVSGSVQFVNTGPSVAAGMTYTLTLSPGLSGVTFGNLPAGATATYHPATGVVTFTGFPATLAPGATASGNGTTGLTVTYLQNASANSTVSAVVGTSTSQGANIAPDAASTAITGRQVADVVTRVVFPDSVAPGQVVRGTVLYRNAGPSAAGVQYVLRLSPGLVGVTFGNLPPGATATYNAATGVVTFAGMPTLLIDQQIASGDGISPIAVQYVQPAAGRSSVHSAIETTAFQGPNVLPDVDQADVAGTVPAPDLALAKVAGSSEFVPGARASWTLTVTNRGSGPTAAPVVITDTLAAGLSDITANGGGFTCTFTGQVVACVRTAVLAPGEAASLVISAAVTGALARTALTNIACVRSAGDTRSANDCGASTTPVTEAAVGSIRKEAVGSFSVGRPGAWNLWIRNLGTSSIAGPLTVTDTIPPSLGYLSATAPGWQCTVAGGVLTCTSTGPLARGDSSLISLTTAVTAAALPSVRNCARLAIAGATVANAESCAVAPVTNPTIDLVTSKRASSESAAPGETIPWRIEIVNRGTAATTGPIVMTDTLPASLTVRDARGPEVDCRLEGQVVTCTRTTPLAPGASLVIAITTTVRADAAIEPIVNRACTRTAGDTDAPNDCSSGTVTLTGRREGRLRKAAVGEFLVGERGSWRVVVQNTGTLPIPAPLSVIDTLPTGLTYDGAIGTGWSCSAAASVVTCRRDLPLAVGDSAVLVLATQVTPASGAQLTNCAVWPVGGASLRSCASAAVRADYRLAVEITTPIYERALGDAPEFVVLVRNVGRSPLPGVVATSTLPRGFTYVPASSRRGGRPDLRERGPIADPSGGTGPAITWPVGDLLPGQVVRIDYRAHIRVGASFNIDNITTAIAKAAVPGVQVISNTSTTPVRLRRDVFDNRGTIAGKVYIDCQCAHGRMQGDGDVGIPGVRLLMEDGTGAITDSEGKYNFINVRAGMHVVRVDETTLPPGAQLEVRSSRNAGDGRSRFVDLKAGELHRADFVEASRDSAVLRAVRERRRQPEGLPPGGGAAVPLAAWPVAELGAAIPPGGMQALTDSATRSMGSTFESLVAPRSLHDGNSNLAAPPRRAQGALESVAGSPAGPRVEVVLPYSAAPADGRQVVPVVVRVKDAQGAPFQGPVTVQLEASAGTWQTPDADSTDRGLQLVVAGGEAQAGLRVPQESGAAEVRAMGGQSTHSRFITFTPAPRAFLAVGLLNGRLDLRQLTRGHIDLGTTFDAFDDPISTWTASGDSGRVRGGLRGALLMKGTVKQLGLLTLAFDSERDSLRGQFRDITPDAGFPVFGDASWREFDAQSQQRFYARLDRGTSFLRFGDFATPRSDERRLLSAYDRSMTGLQYHRESRSAMVSAFASRNAIRQLVDEVPGRGLSGPYYLTRLGVLNSERVEIVTRDRNQPAVILKTQRMQRFEDYTVEPGTTRLLFRAPVPSLDANFNPVTIRITYEALQGGDQYLTYGADARWRRGDRVEAGVFGARDENPLDEQTMLGISGAFRPVSSTVVLGEMVRTRTGAGHLTGSAWRLEVQHESRRVTARAFALAGDTAFVNRSSTFLGGRSEFGARVSAAFDDRTRLVGEIIATDEERTDASRRGASLAVERRLSSRVVGELGYRWADEEGQVSSVLSTLSGGGFAGNVPGTTGLTPLSFSAARARLSARLQERSAVFGEYELGVGASGVRRASVGGEYILFRSTRLYARHEFISTQRGPYALADARDQQNTVVGIDADWLRNSQVFSEYRARDAFNGRDAEASMGLRNRWVISNGLVANTSLERVSPLVGTTGDDAYAVTGAVEYTRSERFKTTGRMEVRTSTLGDQVLASVGHAHKLSRDLTLLARTLWDRSGDEQARGRSQLALAWRQTDRNAVNGLVRLDHRLDQQDALGAPTARSTALVLAGLLNVQPASRFTVSSRYAAKRASDRRDGASVWSTSQLLMGRGIFDFTRRVDGGVIGSVMGTNGFGERQYGVGAEVGVVVLKNLRLAGGYNVFGFTDRDFTALGYTQRGPYVEFGLKLDEGITGYSPARGSRSRR